MGPCNSLKSIPGTRIGTFLLKVLKDVSRDRTLRTRFELSSGSSALPLAQVSEMRLLWGFLALASCLCALVQADLADSAALLPACGLKCTVAAIAKSTCSPTNETCICTNKDLISSISVCVQSSCTIKEQLTTKNVSDTACGYPVRDVSNLIDGFGVGGGFVALLFFITRIVSRFTLAGINFGMDDYTITVAMACLVGFSALSTELAKHGLGRDIWTIPFDSITYILKIYFIDELLYLVVISMTKLSILFFYLRIFPDKTFRKIAYGVMGFCVAYMITFLLVSIFQCNPVKAAWLHWDGSYHGACNNVNAQGWAAAAFNIALDLTILLLPLRQLSKLVMGWKKKFQLLLMFLVGGFVTIVSVIRLETLFKFSNNTNFTWESAPFGYWSTIEMDVGIVCACMPAVQALLKRIWPTVFSTTLRDKSTGKSASSGRSNPSDLHSQPKSVDTKDFVPLVEIGSVRDVEGGREH